MENHEKNGWTLLALCWHNHPIATCGEHGQLLDLSLNHHVALSHQESSVPFLVTKSTNEMRGQNFVQNS